MKYYVLGAVLAVAGCTGTQETATRGAEHPASAAQEVPEGSAVIGEELTAAPAIPLATIRADPARYFERTLLVEATAAAVCQAKGCWLTLSDGTASTSEPIWVRWSSGCGGAYAFPQDIVGKKIWVQGSLYAKTISPEDAEHLAQESASLKADDIAGDAFEMNATACVILPAEAGADGEREL